MREDTGRIGGEAQLAKALGVAMATVITVNSLDLEKLSHEELKQHIALLQFHGTRVTVPMYLEALG